jgi:hypothetical protein
MRSVKLLSPWPLLVLLAATAVAPRTEPVQPILAPLTHSALVTLEGASLPGELILRIRPNAAGAPISVSDLTVAIDGKPVPASARADGAWRVALPSRAAATEGQLDVTVTHDGIRELLSAKIPLAAAAAPATPAPQPGGSGVHNQLLWWVLNIAIVLIAALAISRRKS